MREECIRRGYSMVFTPHIMRRELWKISGHEENYAENMYPPMELDDAEYRLKPMNCPGHILIYKNSPQVLPRPSAALRRARQRLPLRAQRHHARPAPRARLHPGRRPHLLHPRTDRETRSKPASTSPKPSSKPSASRSSRSSSPPGIPKDKKFIGSAEKWDSAVGSLTRVLDRKNIPYKTIPGEAAFYGPKIDIKLVDVLGRLWQLSTVQFDWNLPARFDLEYIGEDGAPAPARHGPPRPLRLRRTLLRRPHRALRRSLPHVASPRASRPRPHQRKTSRLRQVRASSASKPPASASKPTSATKR